MLLIMSLPSEDPDVAILFWKCVLWIFPSFLEGECVRVTGLSENLGTRLKCVFYPK